MSADDNAPVQAREVEVVARLQAVRLGVEGQPGAERRHLTANEARTIWAALAPIREAERQEAAREAAERAWDEGFTAGWGGAQVIYTGLGDDDIGMNPYSADGVTGRGVGIDHEQQETT